MPIPALGGCRKRFFTFPLVFPLRLLVLQPFIAISAVGGNLQDALDVQPSTAPEPGVSVLEARPARGPRESYLTAGYSSEYLSVPLEAEAAHEHSGGLAGPQTEKASLSQQNRNTRSNKGLWSLVLLAALLSLGAFAGGLLRAPWEEAPSQVRARLIQRVEHLRLCLPLANMLASTLNTAEAFRQSDLVKENLAVASKAKEELLGVPVRHYPLAGEGPVGLRLQERLLNAMSSGVGELRALQQASHQQVERLSAAALPMALVSPSLAQQRQPVVELLGADYWDAVFSLVKSFEKDNQYLCFTAKSVYERSKEEVPIQSERQQDQLLSAVLNLQYMHFAENARATAEEAAASLQAALASTVRSVMLKEIDVTLGVAEVSLRRLQFFLRLHKEAQGEQVITQRDKVTGMLDSARQGLSQLSAMYAEAEEETGLEGLKEIRRKTVKVATRVMKQIKDAEELAENLPMADPLSEFRALQVELAKSVSSHAERCHREIREVVEHLKVMGFVGSPGAPGARPFVCRQYLAWLMEEAERAAGEAEVATTSSAGIVKLLEASDTVEAAFKSGKELSAEMERAVKARQKTDVIIAHARMLHNLEVDMATSASAAEAAPPKGVSGRLKEQVDAMKTRVFQEQKWAAEELSLAEIAEYTASMRARVERIDFVSSERGSLEDSGGNDEET